MNLLHRSDARDGRRLQAREREAYRALEEDFADLRADLRRLRDDVASLGAVKTHSLGHKARHTAAALGDKARDTADYAAEELYELSAWAGRAARKRPIASAAAALAVSYFISKLVRR